MMTMQSAKENTLSDLLSRLREAASNTDDPMSKLRTAAWDKYSQKGLPLGKEEVFRYLTLRKLYAKTYVEPQQSQLTHAAIAPWILPECTQSYLVFVNGFFSPSLSNTQGLPSAVSILTLTDAYRAYGAFVTNQWQKQLKDETDPFALLNSALHSNGAFIYLPPRIQVDAPLQILSVIDTQDQPMLMIPRWQLFAGAQSSIHIVEREAVLSGTGYASIAHCDLAIEDNAHVKLTQAAWTDREDTWRLDAARAILKRHSTLNSISLLEGGEGSRLDWRIALTGENAEANISGLGLLDGTREGHVHVLIDHQAPDCRSMQLYKNVLRGSSRSSFEGKIYVHPIAQKTDAFQLNNNLLLSEHAQAFSKPNLEIFADDVKASHGSTFGQLDEEPLFYLQARGLSKELAQQLLVNGFCREVLDQLSIPSLNKELGRATDSYIAHPQ